MTDVVIIGGGPAGVSAALYAVRGGLRVTLLTLDASALAKAAKIDNYYGFPQGISGKELFDAGLTQARNLGVDVRKEEVLSLSFGESGYEIKTSEGDYTARAVVLACGTSRMTPDIPGIRELEGSGVSYCAVCDAFFFKQKSVVVIGNGNYAVEEARILAKVAKQVTICTDGAPAPACEFPANPQKIAAIEGDDAVRAIRFSDGSSLAADGVFVALGTAGTGALALKLGAATEKGRIVTDDAMRTNLPLLYAVGDCTGGLLQISKAVHDGAVAGLDLVKSLRKTAARADI